MAPRLEYDSTAFNYFAISLVTVFAIPLTYFFVKQFLDAFSPPKALNSFRSKDERAKFEKLKQRYSPSHKLFTCSFLFKALLVLFCWGTFLSILSNTGEDVQIAQFDPFAILGIEAPASYEKADDIDQSVVKRAYRTLSRKWHPDKWQTGTPEELNFAEMKFLQISKAYKALTDEESMRNFIEFGNPDGRQSLAVSIGLPSFLLEKGNQNLVLVVYLLAFVVFVLLVGVYYSNSKQYSDKFVLNDTYAMYAYLLDENFIFKHMPEVLALSAEFRTLETRAEDQPYLTKLEKSMKADGVMMPKPCQKIASRKMFMIWPACNKANILLHAYLNRRATEEHLSKDLLNDLDEILVKSPLLVEVMLEVAAMRGVRLVSTVMEFSQSLNQALWVKSSDLQVLPYFGEREVRYAKSGKGAIRTLREFLEAPVQDRLGNRKKGTVGLNDEQVKEIENVCPLIPDIDFKVEIGVLNDDAGPDAVDWLEFAAEDDFLTILCTMTHLNMKPSAKEEEEEKDDENLAKKKKGDRALITEQGPVYAPHYPVLKEEEWFLVVSFPNDNRVLGLQKIVKSDRKIVEKITLPSKGLKPGVHIFNVTLKSTCYVGLDQKRTVKVDLKPRSAVKEFEYHPEDLEVENEPSLYEQLGLGGDQGMDSDSDFDSDDEDDSKKAEAATTLRQRKPAAKEGDGNKTKEDDDYEMVEGEKEE